MLSQLLVRVPLLFIRFMRFLVTKILQKNANYNDETVSPKIRQVLQHWGYVLTKRDFDNEVKRRNSI